MRVECQDVKFKESRNLCTTHDILHNLPIKQSLRKMICSATIVQENNSVDHDYFDEDFENVEPIPNTTDDDQEDIADENSFEDLHSDSSNDCYIDYVVIAETSTAIDCSSKDFGNYSDGTIEGRMRPVRLYKNKIDQNIRFEDSWEKCSLRPRNTTENILK
ncbi:hypothetical protein ACOME3_008825 [Neoechinorhynchus agilis]